VEKYDLLPKRICINCQKLIIYFYDYRQLCIKNDNLIKLHFQINTNNVINDVEEDSAEKINGISAEEQVIINEKNVEVIKNEQTENATVKEVKRKRGRPFKANANQVPVNEISDDELTKRKSLRSRKVNQLYKEFVTPLETVAPDVSEAKLTNNLEQESVAKKTKRKYKKCTQLPDLSPKALEEFKKKSKTIPQESHKFVLDIFF